MKNNWQFPVSLLAALAAGFASAPAQSANISKSLCVGSKSLTLSGKSVTFWGYGTSGGMGGGMGMCSPSVPGPVIEVGVADALSLGLSVNMMTPQESAPYNGHTIHMHGADVSTAQDGVPETNGGQVNGATYAWSPAAGHEGSYAYHCHVHTVKHLEMGMYGVILVRPKGANGGFLNQITANAATAYDYQQVYVLGTVDPAYHTATGDSTAFADYNPAYFLISGKEGKTASAPAISLTAAKSKKVAFRVIGMHSVNATFKVADASGNAQPFTVYVEDGRALPAPRTVASLDLSPGQRADLILTLPSVSGSWYPQVVYKSLRDGAAYATVYGKVSF